MKRTNMCQRSITHSCRVGCQRTRSLVAICTNCVTQDNGELSEACCVFTDKRVFNLRDLDTPRTDREQTLQPAWAPFCYSAHRA
jgi:hypothetical protein